MIVVLPTPEPTYNAQNEAATRHVLEQTLAQLEEELLAIRAALAVATSLPIKVRT